MKFAIILAVLSSPLLPQWPTWGGPDRNFAVRDSPPLANQWPKQGPRRLWTRPLGDGYSAIAIDRGTLYTGYRHGTEDRVVAIDAATGATRWEAGYPSRFVNAYSEGVGPGPYVMPQAAGDRLVMVTGTGKLVSIDRNTGRAVWHRELWSDLGGERLPYGYTSHPLLYKDTLICLVGADWWSGAAAFRQSDGELLWKRIKFKNAYSSPLLIQAGGKEQVVALGGEEVIAFEPAGGGLLWRLPHQTPYGIAVSTPVWNGVDMLFTASAYGKGAQGIRVTATGASAWSDPKIQSHFGNGFIRNGVLYLTSGYNGPAFLSAVDPESGKIRWQERGFSKGQIVLADGKLIVLDQEGVLGLVRANPDKFEELSRAQVLEKFSWTPPTSPEPTSTSATARQSSRSIWRRETFPPLVRIPCELSLGRRQRTGPRFPHPQASGPALRIPDAAGPQ